MKAQLLILVLAFLSGCDTYQRIRPAVSGRVVAQQSLEPVAGASVFFEGDKRLFLTDDTGRFSIPEEKKRVGLFHAADRFPRHTLVVTKRNWEPAAIQLIGVIPVDNYPIELRPVLRLR